MAHLVPNVFTSFKLDEKELEQGTLLTITQKQVIHNQIADLAESKLALVLDTANPTEFVQTEAYKRGQIDALQYLLASAQAVEEDLKATQEPE